MIQLKSGRCLRVGPRASATSGIRVMFAAVFVILGTEAWGVAPEGKQSKVAQEYSRAIAQAQADLNVGNGTKARRLLEATDKSQRSFEYEYLLTRAQAKDATRDLVHTVAAPVGVESRYGVMNEVDRQLVFVCRDGGLRIYDLNTPNAPPKTEMQAEWGAIWCGAFSSDGKTFVAGHENGNVAVWDNNSWKLRHTVALGSNSPVRELAVAPDGTAFVAEGAKELELWSLTDDQPKKIAGVGERYNFGEGLAFSPKGDLLATGGMFDIVCYNAKTGEKLKSMPHASYTMGLEFSLDGTRIASAPRGNINKFLSVFDVAEGKSIFTAGPFENYVAGLAFTPDGKRVAATGPQQDVRLFDAASGEVVLALKRSEHTAKPAFSRDGRLLGWSESDGYHFIDLGKKLDGSK